MVTSWLGITALFKVKVVPIQRIEAYWSKLRQGGGGWWMNFFQDLRDSGVFLDDDPLNKECLKLCFMPSLRKELHSAANL